MGALWGLVAVMAGGLGGLMHAVNASAGRVQTPSFWFMGLATAIAWGGASLVLRRSHAVAMRRVTGGIAASAGIALLTMELAWLGEVPLAAFSLWVGSWLWVAPYVAILTILPHLLPGSGSARGNIGISTRSQDPVAGAAEPWRTRAALGFSLVTLLVVSVIWATTPYQDQDFPLQLRGLANPVGWSLASHPLTIITMAVLLLVATALAVWTVVVRWWRSSGRLRQQLKWLLLGVVATLVLAGLARLLPAGETEIVAGLAMLPLPITIAIAILRHGLWDVDVVISRTIVYALVVGTVVATHFAAAWLLGIALGGWAGISAAAAVVAALVALALHARLRRWVNVRVHGDDEEPYAALARLGERLAAASSPDDISARVLPALVKQMTSTLHATGTRLELTDGTSVAHGVPVGVNSEGTARMPLAYGGARVGELVIDRVGGFGPADEAVLTQLASRAAVAAHTVLLGREVQRAREAAVTSREEERRRLRRDLHDDIGPALAALALQAEAALSVVADDPEAAAALIGRLVPRLNATVADVRALVRDLRPQALDERGLDGAVRALAERMATVQTPVKVEVGDLPEQSAAVEVAAYRIVAEAVTNAVRHARASEIAVHLDAAGSGLEIIVTDDGVGLPDDVVPGVGLTSMRLRAEEVGGECTISADGSGTTVSPRLPEGSAEPAEPAPQPVRLMEVRP